MTSPQKACGRALPRAPPAGAPPPAQRLGRRERPTHRKPGREGARHHERRRRLVPRLSGRRPAAAVASAGDRREHRESGPGSLERRCGGRLFGRPGRRRRDGRRRDRGGGGRDQHRGWRGRAGSAVRQDRAGEGRRRPARGGPVRQRPYGRLPSRPRDEGASGRRDAGSRRALPRCREPTGSSCRVWRTRPRSGPSPRPRRCR